MSVQAVREPDMAAPEMDWVIHLTDCDRCDRADVYGGEPCAAGARIVRRIERAEARLDEIRGGLEAER